MGEIILKTDVRLKEAMYKAGYYFFPYPPVCHARWDMVAWINYIDAKGKWDLEGYKAHVLQNLPD